MSYRMQRQEDLYESKEHSDCTFIFPSEKIKAHKLLLALCSPVFERMLFGAMGRSEIYIEDIEPAVFDKFLRFIYTSAIRIDSVLEAWSLIYVSQKYFLSELQDLCLAHVTSNLSISNLLMCYEFATLYGQMALAQQCLDDIGMFATGLLLVDPICYHPQLETIISISRRHESIGIALIIVTWAIVECQSKRADSVARLLSEHKIAIRRHFVEASLYNAMADDARDAVDVYNELMASGLPMPRPATRTPQLVFRHRRELKTGYRLPIRSTEILSPCICCTCDAFLFGISVATKSRPTHVRDEEYLGGVSVYVYRKDNAAISKLAYEHEARNVFLRYDDVQNIAFDVPLLCKAFVSYTICVKYVADTHDESVLLKHMSEAVMSNARRTQPVICFSDEQNGCVISGVCFYEV